MKNSFIRFEKLNFEGIREAFPAGCGCIGIRDENDQYAFLDAYGREICKERWMSLRVFSDGLAMVRGKQGWGYINPQGEMVLPCRWYQANPFHQGNALICEHGRRMIINKRGDILFHEGEGYQLLSSFHDGLAMVGVNSSTKRSLKGIFTRRKKRGFPPSCMISGDYDWLELDKFGFVDTDGNMVIKPKLDGARHFSEGLAAVCRYVKDEEKWGYMNTKGELVIPYEWDMAMDFHDGCAIVLDGGVLLDLIDRSGKPAISKRFSGLSAFSNGLATYGVVCTENGVQRMKHGFINRSGEIVLPAAWDDCLSVDFGGLCAVQGGGTWKLIDLNGEIVSDGWDELKPDEDGVGLGRRGGEWWIIRVESKDKTPCIAGAGKEQENEG